MFIVEKFEEGEWKVASRHSQEVDAEAQILIFIDCGILEENLRIVTL